MGSDSEKSVAKGLILSYGGHSPEIAGDAYVAPGKTVTAGELWAGNPAKSIRPVSDAETEFIQDSARRYCQFAKEYMGGD
jgi:carbonic anhydrase/acetyltransferase-like protein (isoleucine patch superfamily)